MPRQTTDREERFDKSEIMVKIYKEQVDIALVEKAFLQRMLNLLVKEAPGLCMAAMCDVRYDRPNHGEVSIRIENPTS